MRRADSPHRSSRGGGYPAPAWAMLVPYVGPAWELTASVPARVEVIDHVVPGALAAVAAALCLARRVRDPAIAPDPPVVPASALAVLAGFWTTATHVSVLFIAADGGLSWAAAVLDASAGPPELAASLTLLLGEQRRRPGG